MIYKLQKNLNKRLFYQLIQENIPDPTYDNSF